MLVKCHPIVIHREEKTVEFYQKQVRTKFYGGEKITSWLAEDG